MDKRKSIGEDMVRAGYHPCTITGILHNGQHHNYMGWFTLVELADAASIYPEHFRRVSSCNIVIQGSIEAELMAVPHFYYDKENRRRQQAHLWVVK